ncbi:MAG: hypothetical protein ACTSVV_15670 [Promethearchaeota archaeon]
MPKLIEVHCPKCNKKGKIEVLEEAVKNVSRGLLAISVPIGTVCEHQFIAYIDKNLAVRDCLMADFQIEAVPTEQEAESSVTFNKDELLALENLRLNLTNFIMCAIFKSIVTKKKLLILSNEVFLSEHLLNFIKFITKDTFDFDITLISPDEYKNNKKDYNDYIVVDNKKIIVDKNKEINAKKLKIEEKIIEKFFTERNLTTALIILKNELKKAYNLSQDIINYIQTNSMKGEISSKEIIKYINDKYNIKIDANYLEFLLGIIDQYFGVEVPKMHDVSDFLGLI